MRITIDTEVPVMGVDVQLGHHRPPKPSADLLQVTRLGREKGGVQVVVPLYEKRPGNDKSKKSRRSTGRSHSS